MTNVAGAVPDPAASSAGGARAATGHCFQENVFAWWAAHAVSGTAPELGLDPDVRIDAVGCNTGFPVDDVGVALSDGGFILVQAKSGMRRLTDKAQDFRQAMGQLVSAMANGLPSVGSDRLVDVTRDRLVVATDISSSHSVRLLGTVCERLRDLPTEIQVTDAAKTVDERKSFDILLRIIRQTWKETARRPPTENEIREFLRVLEVTTFDFKPRSGIDARRCNALLQRAGVPEPFSVLAGIGGKSMETREWQQRRTLAAALRWDLLCDQGTARETGSVPDADFGLDVRALLEATAERANRSGLPPHLAPGADVLHMSRTVRLLGRVRRSGDDRGDSTEREDAYALPSERGGRADEAPQPWEQVAAEHGRVMVLGDPGMGKSWLLRLEACRLAKSALALPGGSAVAGDAAVPVLVRADMLAAAPGAALAEAAAWCLARDGLLAERSRERMRDLIASGGAILLIDALDEVPREAPGAGGQAPRKRLDDLLARWTEQCPGARFVVASRLAGYTPLAARDVEEAELLPFTREDIDAAAGAWELPGETGAWLRGQLDNPAVAGMARVPLLLALICSLAADPQHRERDLPRTRAALYGEVTWRFLSGAHRASEHGAPATARDQAERQDLLDVLTHVAFTFAGNPRGWIDRMPYRELADAIRRAGDAFRDLGGSAGTVIERLAGKAGILVPAGNPADGEQDYVFLHRTLAEYLVARYLHELDAGARMKIITAHQWFDPDWAEVIPMLGGLFGPGEREEAAALVSHFLNQRHDPLHHAFRTALRILGETPDPDRLLTRDQNAILARKIRRLMTGPSTRGLLTRTLGEAGTWPRPATEIIVDLLNHGDWSVREAAADALAGRGGDDVTRSLLDLLNDENSCYL